MKRLLVLVPGYLPGFKSGGPVRTIANMVEALGDEFDFSVVCLDRDLGDNASYDSICVGKWNQVGKAKVFYIRTGLLGIFDILNILRNYKFDLIHLNSFLSFKFSILPVIVNNFFGLRVPIILGPRGEFSEGALAFKSAKKNIFISLVKKVGLYRNIVWHASSTYEAADIRRVMGDCVSIKQAIDIAKFEDEIKFSERSEGCPLKVVFISRISPKKNLLGSLRVLSSVHSDIIFDVYGPIEDIAYWEECMRFSTNLPSNVKFKYCGLLPPSDVVETLSKYDLFFFATLGENFGHVIAEALFAGLPVLISDTTPWRNLSEKGVGWDVSLEKTKIFVECIENCCQKSPSEYSAWRSKIRDWAVQNISNEAAIEESRRLFN